MLNINIVKGQREMRKVFAESMTKGKYLTIYGYRSIRKILTSCRTMEKNVNREFTTE